jgi:hypothetical protein
VSTQKLGLEREGPGRMRHVPEGRTGLGLVNWPWHGCSTLSTLDTCSYVRSQEAAVAGTGLSRRWWVLVCVVEYRAVRVLGYAGHTSVAT